MALNVPLGSELTGVLRGRLLGQGPDLDPAFDQRRKALMSMLAASQMGQQQQFLGQQAATGTGRSGSTAAGLQGIRGQTQKAQTDIFSQLAMAQQQQQQAAIENAIGNTLGFGRLGLQSRGLDIQQQQLDEMIRQANEQPGFLELLGGGLGLGASLLGAQGAFPLSLLGGTGGQKNPFAGMNMNPNDFQPFSSGGFL